jgi:hypothetical protein
VDPVVSSRSGPQPAGGAGCRRRSPGEGRCRNRRSRHCRESPAGRDGIPLPVHAVAGGAGQVLWPWKKNIFWRPSSKVSNWFQGAFGGVTVPGTGVRLVQSFAAIPLPDCVAGILSEAAALFPPRSVTMPASCGPGLDVGASWLHLRVLLFHSQVSVEDEGWPVWSSVPLSPLNRMRDLRTGSYAIAAFTRPGGVHHFAPGTRHSRPIPTGRRATGSGRSHRRTRRSCPWQGRRPWRDPNDCRVSSAAQSGW